jgi:nuclear transport factor 2 (NTF2) superfamily protein
MARRQAGDEVAADELLLYLDNERDLYRQKQEIAENLVKKIKKGTYDHRLAGALWGYVVERAAKKYAKEFSASERDWSRIFPPATRDIVSKQLADRWFSNAKAGRPDEV